MVRTLSLTLIALATACLWQGLAREETAYAQGAIGQLPYPAVYTGSRDQSAPAGGTFASDPRLSEGDAEHAAAADSSVAAVLLKHPELEQHASFDARTRVWQITWTHPISGRIFITATVDDSSGAVVSRNIIAEAYFDTLPVLTESEAKDLAKKQEKVKDELRDHPHAEPSASLGKDSVWTVSFYDGSNEIARVLIDDNAGNIKEVMTGPQVAWQMARGYPGAFGRIINEPYVWLPLCLLFLAPFFDVRRPFKLLNLDLLVLLSFTISHYFFNEGEIFKSVPLAYPPLAYLFIRLVWIAVRKAPGMKRQPTGMTFFVRDGVLSAKPAAPATPELGEREGAAHVHLNFSPKIFLALLMALIIFRITINVADSNVVDVGYSGVIGAYRIMHNQTPYGHMSNDDQNGDTYGPFNYLAYVPFVSLLHWSGRWDDLPAAHATAIFFDLAAIAGMFFAGRSLGGRSAGYRLGLAFAYAWAAFPYTDFVLNCNVNDGLVAAFLIWGFVFIKSAPVSGLLLGLATQVKFFPAIMAPLWASFPDAWKGWRRRTRFILLFLAGIAIAMPVVFLGGGSLRTFLDRSIIWQFGRSSPFSIWGQHPALAGAQRVGQYVLIALAVLVYFWPRRKTRTQIAAGSAALVVGFQIFLTHWFYLYIPWFFPLALIAFLMISGRKRAGQYARSIAAPSF
ncbi:MAG: DUF2029 domain-containing protein [Actinobacteria bacterium]|nr:DUF2029 domain-containing protein [Actinomycetota bacterium]